jgi:hypothetical protein
MDFTNKLTNLGMRGALSNMGNNGGLAKSARFAVFITIPTGLMGTWKNMGRELVYLCEAAEMPGRAFMSVDARYYGPSHKLPYQTQYEDTTMTFLCRSESNERKFFDDWLEYINPTNSFDFNFRDNYATDVQIRQMAEYEDVIPGGPGAPGLATGDPKETYRITLRKAYPINVNPQPMTWADDQYQRLAVTFTYFKWMRVGHDQEPKPSGDTFVDGKQNIISVAQGGKRTPISFIR